MSFVTYAELLKGAERSTRKAEVLRRIEALSRQVEVAYLQDAAICEHYAVQSAQLKLPERRLEATICGSLPTPSPKGRHWSPTVCASVVAFVGW